MFLYLFSGTLYIKVFKNKFCVRHIETGNEITMHATQAFTTKRLLVGQFSVAEKLLKKAIKKAYKINWLSASPMVVIHPMEMIEGGLSEVEKRVFKELAAGAGARKIVVWEGHELSDNEVTGIVKKNNASTKY